MARPKRNTRSRDMVISMVVLLVPLMLIMWLLTDDPEPDVTPVDVAPHLARAEEESPYPVLRAEALPEDWVPTRVAWAADGARWIDAEPARGNSWQLGYLGPDEIYYGVEQRDRDVAQAVNTLTREGEATGETVDAAGWTWERYESDDERTRSLVAREGDMVAVVSADTSFEALEAFATSLTTG